MKSIPLKVCLVALAQCAAWLPGFGGVPTAIGGGYLHAGLTGEYYANASFSGQPQFTRRDVRLNFKTDAATSWGGSRGYPFAGYPADGFSVRWSGQLRARFAETYTFRTIADDSVVVKLKRASDATFTTVIDQPAFVPSGTTGAVALEADVAYDIEVEFVEQTGDARLVLLWSSPSTPEEVIDAATELSINYNTYKEDLFADAFQNGRSRWEAYNGGSGAQDANGWPVTDCSFIISETLPPYDISPLETGDMAGSFSGRADLSTFGNCEIVAGSVVYDSGTNTTSFTLRGIDKNSNVLHLRFANTDRDGDYGADGLPDKDGLTNLKVMRIDPDTQTPYPTSQLFNNPIREAFGRLTAIRFQRTNDQAVHWQDRTQPDGAFIGNSTRLYVYNERYNNGDWNLMGSSGIAHEYEIMLCNELGADYYVTVPHLATATGPGNYMKKLAQLIRYGSDAGGEPYSAPTADPYHPPLNPNLRVYVEIANELWNFAALSSYAPYFDYLHLMEDLIAANDPIFAIVNFDNLPLTLNSDGIHANNYTWVKRYWAYLLKDISDTFRTVFGDAAMPGNGNRDPRIRPFFTWQYGDANATASTGLKFMDNYFNNHAGNFVATPRPVNYYFWAGGGAGYYSTSNRDGWVDPNPIPNPSFEDIAVTSLATDPADAAWSFNANAGIVPNRTRTAAVTGQSVSATLNNTSNHVGHRFTVGANPIVVYELGRYVHAGNSRTHTLRIARASDGQEITYTNAIATSGTAAGSYAYGRCIPVVLDAHTSYYLFSSETVDADTFGDASTTVTTDGAYAVDFPATATLSNGAFTITDGSGAGQSYGPLSLRYAPVWEIAPGSPVNNPDSMPGTAGTLENGGSQVAWLRSSNGNQGAASVSFTVPEQVSSNVYALSYRWTQRTVADKDLPDATTLKITAWIGGVAHDITPIASSTQPRQWQPGNEWRLIRYWTGNYYWSETFEANAGATVTITFETANASGDHVAFLDDIHLGSIDAFYASSDLGAGAATGQTAARYPKNQYDDGKWCAAYGLMQMTYEHGFSAGGDSGNSPLQNYAKFVAPEARQTVIDALDVFQQAGGRIPTFGTYSTWPSFQSEDIDGVRVFGTGNSAVFPLTEGMDVIMAQLPEKPLNGIEIPAIISGQKYTLTAGGDELGTIEVDEWNTYNFVAVRPKSYRMTLLTSGTGNYELRLDGSDVIAASAAGGMETANLDLDYGVHAVQVRSTSGTLTVNSITFEETNAPDAPLITGLTDGDGSVLVEWSPVTGATGYTVHWGTGSQSYLNSANVGNASSYRITGLLHDTQYYITVRAYNAEAFSLPAPERSLIALTNGLPGTLLSWEFDGNEGGEVTVPVTASTSRLTVSAITRGDGWQPSTAAWAASLRLNRFGTEPGAADGYQYETTLAAAAADNDYYEFSVSPNAGLSMSLSQLSFILRFQNNRPDQQGLGYAYKVGDGPWVDPIAIAYVDSEELYSIDLSGIPSLQNVADPVVFRIYAYGLNAYEFSALGATSGTDVALNGSLNERITDPLTFWLIDNGLDAATDPDSEPAAGGPSYRARHVLGLPATGNADGAASNGVIALTGTQPEFSLSHNSAATGHILSVLVSPDLSPGSWSTAYTFHGSAESAFTASKTNEVELGNGVRQITLQMPALLDGRIFVRLSIAPE